MLFEKGQQQLQIMSERVHFAEQGKSGLEQFLCCLLCMEPEYLISEDIRISHAPERGDVAPCGLDERVCLLNVAHRLRVPHAARAPVRG